MDEISLRIMTRELCHQLYFGWENDPSICTDMKLFAAYRYDENAVNKYFDEKQNPSRILFAIMKGEKPIGELQLKQINMTSKECTLSIHLQNDMVKGKGYGARAEQLAVQYAFDELGMVTVNADTISKTRVVNTYLKKSDLSWLERKTGLNTIDTNGKFQIQLIFYARICVVKSSRINCPRAFRHRLKMQIFL